MRDVYKRQLVERIKQGENSLMSDLYMNCRRFIIALIKRIGIEQAEDCEDAMQDAYFGLYEAVKGFEMCIRDSVSMIQANFGSYKDYDMKNRFFNMNLAGGAMPVSYTHLDVYKRQVE